ncbi:putative hydrolase or acyltransferase [Elusimicrobium minutum Pei191]|uniref:Putative hydrolase or acyltransferase n=1 Tax=Elusimicrobium minutum (strain Pei191) TaxID=445932 RepID=B2KCT4_ELUMP|nr:alpha/beta hydrolase [Elusimicrobium minutum]ACC98330.1 putative hydrolase or acyltransferase [Elusimicrobium minutum Pei191]
MIRYYGKKPYKAVVVHGGPGALGSLGAFAGKLSSYFGVAEPIQTKYSINELIEELHGHITCLKEKEITLLGHSWGALLCVLYAAKYSQKLRRVILVSSASFEERFSSLAEKTRRARLTDKEYQTSQEILARGDAEKINKFFDKTDNYDAFEEESALIKFDLKMLNEIWNEASGLRNQNKFISSLKKIKCPITVIHGEYDPHPYLGVVKPLEENGVKFDKYILPKCGHYPYRERFACDVFYQILKKII